MQQVNSGLCWQFQSTLPRGSDAGQVAYAAAVIVFQSTLPRGSDQQSLRISLRFYTISIHAPSRERHRYSGSKQTPA